MAPLRIRDDLAPAVVWGAGLQQEFPLRQPGRVVDVAARIERRQVLGGLISEYRRVALAREKTAGQRPSPSFGTA